MYAFHFLEHHLVPRREPCEVCNECVCSALPALHRTIFDAFVGKSCCSHRVTIEEILIFVGIFNQMAYLHQLPSCVEVSRSATDYKSLFGFHDSPTLLADFDLIDETMLSAERSADNEI